MFLSLKLIKMKNVSGLNFLGNHYNYVISFPDMSIFSDKLGPIFEK